MNVYIILDIVIGIQNYINVPINITVMTSIIKIVVIIKNIVNGIFL
jgi:hypothetical protein